jgi:hypothetical protein
MKKSLLSLAVLGAAFAASNADAFVVDPYLGVSAGLWGEVKPEGGESLSMNTFGAQFGLDIPFVRGEVEYNYVSTSELTTNAWFINAYLKPMPGLPIFTPYIGGGIGSLFGTKLDIMPSLDFDAAAAYQGMIGTDVSILAIPVDFTAEFRVVYSPELKAEKFGALEDLVITEFRVKASYQF